jgi:hypothetical protein
LPDRVFRCLIALLLQQTFAARGRQLARATGRLPSIVQHRLLRRGLSLVSHIVPETAQNETDLGYELSIVR